MRAQYVTKCACSPLYLPCTSLTILVRRYDPAESSRKADFKKLPFNLSQALDALEADNALTARLGNELVSGYLHLRRQQWDEYCQSVSQWELDNTLDA